MFNRISATLAYALLFAVIFHADAEAQEMIAVRVAYVPAVPGLAAWVAKERGFFAEQGLDVSFIPIQNVSLMPGTVGKQVDIGMVTAPDVIKASAGGLNVTAVSGGHFEVEGSTTNILVARKGSGVKSIKDIAGKTVGTPTVGAILHVALLYWMKKEGVNLNSIRAVEVPFPNMPDQMAAGRIDVAVAAQPFADRMIAEGNLALGNQLLEVASPVLATLWIADRTWAEQNKLVIAKWTAAMRQAKDFIVTNPGVAREVLAQYSKLPVAVVQTLALPHFETTLQAKDLDVWIKVLADLNQLRNPVEASKLLTTAR
jgi:ABC-type nitrate/sulfonate/bicarbonate transport system substrate-binding protein